MKFINYLETITGIGIYPLTSLILFTGFFTAVTFWALYIDNGIIDRMKNIPLDPTHENQ
jgi:cytochrome c oxidase cbb3-type subunit 3